MPEYEYASGAPHTTLLSRKLGRPWCATATPRVVDGLAASREEEVEVEVEDWAGNRATDGAKPWLKAPFSTRAEHGVGAAVSADRYRARGVLGQVV